MDTIDDKPKKQGKPCKDNVMCSEIWKGLPFWTDRWKNQRYFVKQISESENGVQKNSQINFDTSLI